MAVKFNCGSCGKRLGVADHLAGRKGKCPQCGTVFTVPGPDAPPPPPPPRAMRREDTDYGVAIDERPADAPIACPTCGGGVPGGAAFCPACGVSLRPGQCPSCCNTVDSRAAFCPTCGTGLRGGAPAPLAASAMPQTSDESPQVAAAGARPTSGWDAFLTGMTLGMYRRPKGKGSAAAPAALHAAPLDSTGQGDVDLPRIAPLWQRKVGAGCLVLMALVFLPALLPWPWAIGILLVVVGPIAAFMVTATPSSVKSLQHTIDRMDEASIGRRERAARGMKEGMSNIRQGLSDVGLGGILPGAKWNCSICGKKIGSFFSGTAYRCADCHKVFCGGCRKGFLERRCPQCGSKNLESCG